MRKLFIFLNVFLFTLVLLQFNSGENTVHAEMSCSMTIDASVHNTNNLAMAGGECADLERVWGYHEGGNFFINNGEGAQQVNHSGQQFNNLIHGQEATVTVNIVEEVEEEPEESRDNTEETDNQNEQSEPEETTEPEEEENEGESTQRDTSTESNQTEDGETNDTTDSSDSNASTEDELEDNLEETIEEDELNEEEEMEDELEEEDMEEEESFDGVGRFMANPPERQIDKGYEGTVDHDAAERIETVEETAAESDQAENDVQVKHYSSGYQPEGPNQLLIFVIVISTVLLVGLGVQHVIRKRAK